MSDERMVVPDVTQPIYGARLWHVASRKRLPGLPLRRELTSGDTISRPLVPWPADGPLQAACHAGYVYFAGASHERMAEYRKQHKPGPPIEGCSCGIYAVADPYDLERYYYGTDEVFGVVALWGRVIPGSRGWRAQFARPVQLIAWEVPTGRKNRAKRAKAEERNRDIERVAADYGIPVATTWPALTKPEEVASWTSAESTR